MLKNLGRKYITVDLILVSFCSYQAPGNIDPFWKRSIHQSNEKKNAAGQKMQDDRHGKGRRGGKNSLDPPSLDNPRKKKQKRKEGPGSGSQKQKRKEGPENGSQAQNKQEQSENKSEAMET